MRRTARAADGPVRTAPTELGSELLVIGFGHAEQIGDHEQGERARELADELARAVGDELVDLRDRRGAT